jgi:hypothetical protein
MSPTSPIDPSRVSYVGPRWAGGDASAAAARQGRRERRERMSFWENLCGTGRDRPARAYDSRGSGEEGSDSEDDEDQAGRTNPFE